MTDFAKLFYIFGALAGVFCVAFTVVNCSLAVPLRACFMVRNVARYISCRQAETYGRGRQAVSDGGGLNWSFVAK